MLELGRLSAFNVSLDKDLLLPDIRKKLSKFNLTDDEWDNFNKLYPNVCSLVSNTTKFYMSRFSELPDRINREKRQLYFESPNKVKVSHEYTIKSLSGLSNGPHYLFNPLERLNWLSVLVDGKHVAIASKNDISGILLPYIKSEIESLRKKIPHSSYGEVFDLIYTACTGRPCFVFLDAKDSDNRELLLNVEFYDCISDIQEDSGCTLLNPLCEKMITYEYSPLSKNVSSWLFVKAPKGFNINLQYQNNGVEAITSQTKDVQSAVIIPNGRQKNRTFKISVSVPSALKTWYLGVYWLSVIFTVIALFTIISVAVGFWPGTNLAYTQNLPKCLYALVAAIIATRGWMINDEYVYQKLSIAYTVNVILLLISALTLILI